ncbi:MAG: hypothetical protein WD005_02935 [Haliea sp.]
MNVWAMLKPTLITDPLVTVSGSDRIASVFVYGRCLELQTTEDRFMWLRKCIALILAPVLSVGSLMTLACDPVITHDQFCQRAQQLMTGTRLLSENVVYTDWAAFRKSKANELPLTTHQFVNRKMADGETLDIPVTVSCKLKTAERINHGLIRSGNPDTTLAANQERTCKAINQATWRQLSANLPAQQVQLAQRQLVFDEDEVTWIGPFWLRPFPYQVAYLDEDGKTHIRSKALYTEYSVFIPMPDSFKGTHYCHLIAPEYLSALATGKLQAPPLHEDQ